VVAAGRVAAGGPWMTARGPRPNYYHPGGSDGGATGVVRTSQCVTPLPDGATGWHSITVTVG